MKLFQNPYVVGTLGVAALLLVGRNALGPVWSRIAHRKPTPAQAPTVVAPPATMTPETPSPAEVLVVKPPPRVPPAAKIDLAQVGWKANSSPHRDPFQVTPATITNLARLYPLASEVLRLQAIWWQSGSILASVDGRVVHEGDVIYPTNCTVTFTVARIGAERIWLDGPSGTEVLPFDATAGLSNALGNSFLEWKGRTDWPYRVVNGRTNDAYLDPGWETFRGKVLQTTEAGEYLVDEGGPQPYILRRVPLEKADGERLPAAGVRCKSVGLAEYISTANARKRVRAFDFGERCLPPKPVVDSMGRHAARLVEQANDTARKRVELEIRQAKDGKASAQYMLGRRYLYGDGVGKDPQAARALFEASAAQGNPDARAMLSSLAGQ